MSTLESLTAELDALAVEVAELRDRAPATPPRAKGWAWVEYMPSTNVRIFCSILLAMATGARVVAIGWEPHYEWLGFLVLWAGLDVTQFMGKRTTDAVYQAGKTAQARAGAEVARSDAAVAKSEAAVAKSEAVAAVAAAGAGK